MTRFTPYWANLFGTRLSYSCRAQRINAPGDHGETRTFCCQFDVVCDTRGNPVRWDSFAAQPWRLRRSTALFASRAKGASLRAYRARRVTLPASTALTPKLRESGCSCSRKYLPALSASSPFFQSASVPVWLQLIIGISLVQAAYSGPTHPTAF